VAPAPAGQAVQQAQPGTPEAAAATTTQPASAKAKAPEGGLFSGPMSFLPIIIVLVLLYFILLRPQGKEDKNRKKMVAAMKKNDSVMTIGGLVGKVVDIKDDRVVLKVDEANNVKMTYLKSAIQRVLTDTDKAEDRK
jgi:preprotein translocase subunit YajC